MALLAIIGVFYSATLRDGHNWGGDFAHYLHHAENLAQGTPYSETGYVFNPQNFVVGPRAYPPVFPVSLAPTFRFLGRNLDALKVQMIVFFVATVAIATWLVSRDLSRGATLGYMALLGFNPVFWRYKEALVSEHLFLPLWYLAILIADRWYRNRRVCFSPTVHATVLGIVIYLAYGTRSVGIVLLPAVLFSELLAFRRVTRFGWISLTTAAVLILTQKMLLPDIGQGYADHLAQISFGTIKANVIANAVTLGNLWENGVSRAFAVGVTILMTVVSGVAFFRVNWPKPTFLGTAFLLYLALSIVWPTADALRIMLPLLPAVLFYVLLGVVDMTENSRFRRYAQAALVALVAGGYLTWYATADYSPIEGVQDTTSIELFQFIENDSQEGEICLFFKPRVLCFFANCSASAYPLVDDSAALWEYVQANGISILIARKDAESMPECYVAQFDDPRFTEIWQNERFRVLRVARPQSRD